MLQEKVSEIIAFCIYLCLVNELEEKIELLHFFSEEPPVEIPEIEGLNDYVKTVCNFISEIFQGEIDGFWQSLQEPEKEELLEFEMAKVKRYVTKDLLEDRDYLKEFALYLEAFHVDYAKDVFSLFGCLKKAKTDLTEGGEFTSILITINFLQVQVCWSS